MIPLRLTSTPAPESCISHRRGPGARTAQGKCSHDE